MAQINKNQPQAAPKQQDVNIVLVRLIQLAGATLAAGSADKAANILVNRIHTLTRTDRAILVPLKGRKKPLAISGGIKPSQDNSFSQAVEEMRRLLGKAKEPQFLNAASLPKDVKAPNARKVFDSMGGTAVLWLPLPVPGGDVAEYALWLERWHNIPWGKEETRLLSHASIFFGQALSRPAKKKPKKSLAFKGFVLAIVVFIGLMFVPINSRVNAPFQVVPVKPHYVFAPFDGIVKELLVQPGQKVRRGEVVFRYDIRVMEKRLEEARSNVATALAELVRLEGAAYKDEESRARIPVQKLEVEGKKAEVDFLIKQMSLSQVRAVAKGVVVLDDPDALVGAAVQTGQLVMGVADPARTELKIMVPATDAGLVTSSAQVAARLDIDPLGAVPATVTRVGFEIKVSDERIPSVMVTAKWEKNVTVSPGQRGIARIKGPRTLLGLQIFRKPIMTIRAFLGV